MPLASSMNLSVSEALTWAPTKSAMTKFSLPLRASKRYALSPFERAEITMSLVSQISTWFSTRDSAS